MANEEQLLRLLDSVKEDNQCKAWNEWLKGQHNRLIDQLNKPEIYNTEVTD